jgi:tyrosinase
MAKATRKRRSTLPARAARGRKRSLGVPARLTRPGKKFTSKPIPIDFAGPEHRFASAEIEISGIYHGEASYEGRIFLNNPKADETTPRTLDHGYAGSFHIFGHGGCLGDPDHCEINEDNRDGYDFRAPHPLTRASKRVTVTTALRHLGISTREIAVTVVPIVTAANELCDTVNVFRFESLRLLAYNP